MQIRLLAVGAKQPAWVNEAFAEYAKRLPPECRLSLVELSAERRAKNASAETGKQREGQRLLRALSASEHVVALDERGRSWSSVQLSRQLGRWLGAGKDVALLIGGADGLHGSCLARAEQQWSLSPLTLPHGMVRVLVAEQLYRAWSILRGHPYHRA